MTNPEEPESPAAALARLAGIGSDVATQAFTFSTLRNEPGLEARRINATRDLADQFRAAALAFVGSLSDRVLTPYSAGRKPDDQELAYLATEDVPELEPVLNAVGQPGTVVHLNLADPVVDRLRLYVVSLTGPDSAAHFCRAMTPRARLERSRSIRAMFADEVFSSLDRETLLFDTGFDAVIIGDWVLIAKQDSFQRSLNFLERARQHARQTLIDITGSLKIINRDEFMAAGTTQPQMIGKVRSIAEKLAHNPAYREAMTTERLIAFVEARPHLGVEVGEDKDGYRGLVFHRDAQRRWLILKLLDDDYLRSTLTETDYEANSKQQLG